MKPKTANLDEFVFRGLLTEEALDRAGRKKKVHEGMFDADIAATLSIQAMDDDLVDEAKRMAAVYTAVAAFENAARGLIADVLMDAKGENWWIDCVSEKIRNKADSKRSDEELNRWHSKRGADPIYYSLMGDLKSIIRQNWPLFEAYVPSIEWAESIFDTVERSRNVIMHSGTLAKEDIERLGINIRDWIKQVGT